MSPRLLLILVAHIWFTISTDVSVFDEELNYGDIVKLDADSVVLSADRWFINFKDGYDIVFHFNPRFAEEQVVRNSAINGGFDYSAEERSGGFQLSLSKTDPISMEFRYTETKWEVSSQGVRLEAYDFVHRSAAPADAVFSEIRARYLVNAEITIIRAEWDLRMEHNPTNCNGFYHSSPIDIVAGDVIGQTPLDDIIQIEFVLDLQDAPPTSTAPPCPDGYLCNWGYVPSAQLLQITNGGSRDYHPRIMYRQTNAGNQFMLSWSTDDGVLGAGIPPISEITINYGTINTVYFEITPTDIVFSVNEQQVAFATEIFGGDYRSGDRDIMFAKTPDPVPQNSAIEHLCIRTAPLGS